MLLQCDGASVKQSMYKEGIQSPGVCNNGPTQDWWGHFGDNVEVLRDVNDAEPWDPVARDPIPF